MAVSIVNNSTAFQVFKDYTQSYENLNSSMSKLSNGVKSVVDDPSAVGISERMRAQAKSSSAARQNVENGLSVLQTADSWMQNVNDMLARMHELVIMAKDGAKSTTDQENLNTEFLELQEEIARIAGSAAKFNGKNLLDGSFSSAEIQIGPDNNQIMTVQLANISTGTSLTVGSGISWASVVDNGDMSVTSANALNAISGAISVVSNQRAQLGGQMSRMQKTGEGLLTYEDNLRASESKIRDIDAARESTRMAQFQIQTQIGSAMLAQSNEIPSSILQLVG